VRLPLLRPQAFADLNGRMDKSMVQPNTHRPCPFETYPASHLPFTMFPWPPPDRFSARGPQICFGVLAEMEKSIMVSSKARTWVGFRSGIPGIAVFLMVTLGMLLSAAPAAFAAGGTCPRGADYVNPADPFGSLVTLSSLGITSCFYTSKSSGSDSNSGTDEAHPWAHIPGMTSCTNTCHSLTPTPGEGFILKGGDTWVAADLGVVWLWTGPFYIGVDPAWFSGGSWTRPIFTCGYAACASASSPAQYNKPNYLFINNSNVTVDNIEFTGLISNAAGGGPAYSVTQMQNDVIMRSYAHGWHVAVGATDDTQSAFQFNNNNNAPYSSVGSGLLLSIIDGADTTQNSMQGISGNPHYIVGNVIQYVTNGFQGNCTQMHDNYWGTVPLSYNRGAHQNAIGMFDSANGATSQFVYNNVITGTTASGGIVKLWLDQFMAPTTHGYAFNNALYNNAPGNYINIWGHGGNYGPWDIFNNTAECGTDASQGPCAASCDSCNGIVHSQNNHWISSSSGLQCGTGGSCKQTTDLLQTIGTANGQGYTSSSKYAFQPSSGGSTVGAGTNIQSLCDTINGLDTLAGAACKNDVGYACSYNTTNHTVSCPDRSRVVRPTSGAWDIGAYQYSGQNPPPNPPTGLAAVVQ
jgi:hypothetical protein